MGFLVISVCEDEPATNFMQDGNKNTNSVSTCLWKNRNFRILTFRAVARCAFQFYQLFMFPKIRCRTHVQKGFLTKNKLKSEMQHNMNLFRF